MSKSIIQNDTSVCYKCGRLRGNMNCLEKHHVFGGSNRKYSEEFGLWVMLCGHQCHRYGKGAVHQDAEYMQELHEVGQRAFERDHTREEFMKIFGKNYL